ncbi:hypothetical protein [Exiguobacterium algae]|uniref:hypothetical protein n=1 Tax=Exiguobacterium algae TaxID=2751250 RepID=UPI001BE75CC4|nr:hypothetical protein [Exiguobacterium algae]
MKSKIDSENRLHTSQIEYESYKRERVLPKLENINVALIEHQMYFSSYLHVILNRGRLHDDDEAERLNLDGLILENKNKILFYLPRELRLLLNKLRVIVSVSWKDPALLNSTLNSYDGVNAKEVCESVQKIYIDYIECFYELIEEYMKISTEEKKYHDILIRYNFDESVNYKPNNIIDKIAIAYILFHEYHGSEDFSKLEVEIQEYANMSENN